MQMEERLRTYLRRRYKLQSRASAYRLLPITVCTSDMGFTNSRQPLAGKAMPCEENIGKPYARFDEGGQVNVTMIKLLSHRQTKGVETDRFNLRC